MTPTRAEKPEAKARERLRILGASLRRAAKHPGEVDSIHRLRVSIRRFTQVLRVFDGLFSHSRKMRRRLRGLMDLCGAARNCDIAVEVLAAAGVPADAALAKRLKQRRARAGRELAKLLSEWDIRASVRRWRAWLSAKSSGQTALVADVLPALSRRFVAAGRAAAKAGAGFEQMHEFRLLVKRYRYTLEILGGETGGPPVDTLRGLQERLGAINDCVTTAGLIDEIGGEMELGAPAKRKIKAAVNALLARRAAEFRIYWRNSRRTESRRIK
jgi:CHAD domain-containing protein